MTSTRRGLMGVSMDDLNRAFPGKTFTPAQYALSILLSGDDGKTQGGKVQLRPEDFLLCFITWKTNGDTPGILGDIALPDYSLQGLSTEVSWGDEFTQFMGEQSAFVSAAFSEGYYELPGKVKFLGSQTLSLKLTRLSWPVIPTEEFPRVITRWDFVFHGLGIFPLGTNASGAL